MTLAIAATGHDAGRMRQLTAARLVNCFAEAAPEPSRGRLAIHGTPGMLLLASCGAGPGRKMALHGNYLYVVSGTSLYRVQADGSSTLCAGSLPATGLVTMASNGIDLAIVVGTTGYLLEGVGGTSVSPIAHPEFLTPSSVDFIDGYFVYVRAGTGQFFISGLYDGGVYDATDFATAEGSPDGLMRVFVDHREVWLFGPSTTEVWYNSGAGDFPLARVQGAYLERGLAAAGAVTKADNSVFWLGDDRIVYRAAGYEPARVSTHAEENAIREMAVIDDCEAFVDRQGGHIFVVFRFPTEGRTFVYDAATKRWHERQSGVDDEAAWRIADAVYALNKSYGLDALTGAVFTLDMDTFTENGAALRRVIRTPPVQSDKDHWMRVHAVQLVMEAGQGLISGQGSAPLAALRVSRDGGFTWGVELTREIGPMGAYEQRAIWRRLGITRNGAFEFVVTDPVKFSVAGIAAQIEELRA